MNDTFLTTESLLRAVLPADMYWKADGSLSSAAFKDRGGLSVDRTGGRSMDDAVSFARSHLSGTIVYVTVPECDIAKVKLCYLPLCPENIFHSEIHRDEEHVELTRSQAKHLASVAHIVSGAEGHRISV